MLKELVDRLVELGSENRMPIIMSPGGEPSHVYWFTDERGTRLVECEPKPRQHVAGDLYSLVQAIKNNEVGGDKTAEVWYSRAGVRVFLDKTTRRDQVGLLVRPTLVFSTLQALAGKWFDQKSFVRLLRVDLAGHAGPILLETVRKIRFRQTEQASSEVGHGKASVGRAIESQLPGVGILPEDLLLSIPVFDGPFASRHYTINCALEVDSANERFALCPFPGEAERVQLEAERSIGAALATLLEEAELEVPIYYGSA